MEKILSTLALGVVLQALATNVGNAAPLDLFENAYMVAANGSTTPVTSFDINGPAPWLYVDFHGTAGFSGDWWEGPNLSFLWHLAGDPVVRFTQGTHVSPDHAWFAPTAAEWNARKSLGSWRIDSAVVTTTFISIGYGGSQIPVSVRSPAETIRFDVVAKPPVAVPEPSGIALFALGIGWLGYARHRRGTP